MHKPSRSKLNFFVTCPKNLEGLLEQELHDIGIADTKQTVAGVKFAGSLEVAYRVCLWSRIANRVLYPIADFPVTSAESLYSGVRKINWSKHLLPTSTLIVDFAGVSAVIINSHFGALKVKDAIVDQFRDKSGVRPNVAKTDPDLRVNVYLRNNIATLSIDLSGESLHRRGYRTEIGVAPLKENLAAALLYRTKWQQFARENKPLLDPLCGSGTILIEAAMIAQDFAPGLLRKKFGFTNWVPHDKKVWLSLVAEAQQRRTKGQGNFHAEIRGYDHDPQMTGIARRNVAAAGLEKFIDITTKDLAHFTPPTHHGNQFGIIVTNPPYGERMHGEKDLAELYRMFGEILRRKFQEWEVAMLLGNPELGKTMGIRPYKQYNFFNGALPCKFLLFSVNERWVIIR